MADDQERIQQLYREHGSIDEVAQAAGLPRAAVAEAVAAMPDREVYRRRGTSTLTYTRQQLIHDLKRAAAYSGEPLTIPGYRMAASVLGLAADATISRHFSEDDPDAPWRAACRAARVAYNPSRGRREASFTFDDAVGAVGAYLKDSDGRYSFARYQAWAAGREGVPSGSTVRNFLWSKVLKEALARSQ